MIFDAHVHAREADSIEFNEVIGIYTALSGAVYMMNFPNPLDLSNVFEAVDFCKKYYADIMEVAGKVNSRHRALLMPVLNETMRPDQLESFIKRADFPLAGFKLFPKGQSTNSGYAPSTELAQNLIDVVQAEGLPLALHLEDPDEPDASKKEASAIKNILPLLIDKDGKQRDMKISIEHISTTDAIQAVVERNLHCTITPHHLLWCQEDFGITDPSQAEGILSREYPYFFCKPLIQTKYNQFFLKQFWQSGYKGIMLGSDSAPHREANKIVEEGKTPFAGAFLGDANTSYNQTSLGRVSEYSKNGAEFYLGGGVYQLSSAMQPDESNLVKVKNILTLENCGRIK